MRNLLEHPIQSKEVANALDSAISLEQRLIADHVFSDVSVYVLAGIKGWLAANPQHLKELLAAINP